MSTCPSRNNLEDLIAERLVETCRAEVETHVEYCADCQAVLELLTSDDSAGRANESSRFPSVQEAKDLVPNLVANLMRAMRAVPRVAQRRELSLPAPERVGDYRIVREIGRGGMGIVYEADHEPLGRRVALKLLPRLEMQSQSARLRFEREARAAAKMHHTNIVPVFEVGHDGEHYFYAMQLIQGRSLDLVIEDLSNRRGESRTQQSNPFGAKAASSANSTIDARLNVGANLAQGSIQGCGFYKTVAGIGLQAAQALSYSHARGVVHRDIKPSNLLLDEEGVIWVTDFGLAKTGDDAITQTHDFVGTLQYTSPERFRGQCDEQADVYGLGLTLYELLVGQRAFQSPNQLQLIEQIANTEPPRPRDIDGTMPRDLETIVLKAINKEVTERYASAAELADDLRRFIDDVPIQARRASVAERAFRWSRRNRSLAAAIGGVILLSTALLVGSIVTAFSFKQQASIQQAYARKAVVAENKMRAAFEEAKSVGATLQHNLYRAEMLQAGRDRLAPGGMARLRSLTDAWDPRQTGTDLRGWEWYFLRSLCSREQLVLDANNGRVWAIAWSPDGKKLLSGGDDGARVWDADTGRELRSLARNQRVVSVDWSPDGNSLAAAVSPLHAYVWDAKTGNLRQILDCMGRVHRIRWSPDSRWLATSSLDDSDVRLWRLDYAKPVKVLRAASGERPTSLEWTHNGEAIISSDYTGNIFVWNINSGSLDETIEAHSGPAHEVALSPDGKHIVSAGDRKSRIWDIASRTRIREFEQGDVVYTVQWSPDGTQVAVGGADYQVTIWDVESGKEVQTISGHESVVWKLRWTSHPTRIASVDVDVGRVRIWSTKEQQAERIYPITGGARTLAWSPEGERIAVGATDGKLHVWNNMSTAEGDQEPMTIDAHPGHSIRRLAWNATGDQIATTALRDGSKIWSAQTAQQQPLLLHDPEQRSLFLAWDSEEELMVASDTEKTWFLRGSHPDKPLFLEGLGGTVVSFVLSHDHSKITVGTAGVWSTETAQRLLDLSAYRPVAFRWHPDDSKIAGARHATLYIWNATTGAEEQKLAGHSAEVRSIAWSPDGSRLASGDVNRTIKIWHPLHGRETLSLTAQGGVDGLAWSPDGTKLAAACAGTSNHGGVVQIWDAAHAYDESRRSKAK